MSDGNSHGRRNHLDPSLSHTAGTSEAILATRHPVDVHYESLDEAQIDRYDQQMNEIRNRCPVAWSDGRWSPTDTGFWLLTSYRDVREVAMNTSLYSSANGAAPVQQDLDAYRMIPLEMDPPLHTDIRSVLMPFFMPAALSPHEDNIRQIIREVLEGCLAVSPVDFISRFTIAVPSRVFFELFLGEDTKNISWIIDAIQLMIDDPVAAIETATPRLLKWCEDQLESCRLEGRKTDLIGVIAHMGLEQDSNLTLNEKQRVEILNLLILAGMETTANGIGSVLHTLSTQPETRRKLAGADTDRLNKVVDEFLRYSPPVTSAARTLTEDTNRFGCPMQKGERMMLSWTAANHDPEVYANPDTLDLDRNASQHLAFGVGHHKCLGMHLAKREMRLVIEEICKLQVFDLVPGTTIKYRMSPMRGIASLPIHCSRGT